MGQEPRTKGLRSAKRNETHTSIHQKPQCAEQADAILPVGNDKKVKNTLSPTVTTGGTQKGEK